MNGKAKKEIKRKARKKGKMEKKIWEMKGMEW